MKTIETLLNEYKSENERHKELVSLIPELKNGEKYFYDNEKYIYIKDNNLYSGSNKYFKDSIIKGAFPYIFILEKIYQKKEVKND